jgi:ABC-type dipeptide/oligopeptide/nickel transport system permease subunit
MTRRVKAGAALVVAITLVAIFGPLVDRHDVERKNARAGLTELGEPLGPSAEYPLGTDALGRCVLARVMAGARVSLLVAIVATALATLIGTLVGLVAGYRGGATDMALMRLVDLLLAFPFLLLAIALVAVFRDAGLIAVLVILSLTGWLSVARVVRAKVLALRDGELVQGARAIGASSSRVIWRHILPNVSGPIAVMATLAVAQMIVAESTLAFLGFGAAPPTASWGRMLFEGKIYLLGAPWLAIAPGVAVLLTVLAFNLLGDGLAAMSDPRAVRIGGSGRA